MVNSEYILKAEPTGFPNSLDMESMQSNGVRNGYNVICMSNWKGLELSSTELRKTATGPCLEDRGIWED